MGTQKIPNAKKASDSDPAVHKLVAKHKDSTRSPRLTLQKNSKGPESTLRPTKSPSFSPPAPIIEPVRVPKAWQAWEQQLLVSLRKTGKIHAKISQQLPGRSKYACRHQWRLIESRKHHLARIQSSRKSWKDWEDQIVINNRAANKTWTEITKLLPDRTEASMSVRYYKFLRPRLQDSSIPQSQHCNLPLGTWSQGEHELLVSLRAAGKSWAKITRKIPNRSLVACERHWANYHRPCRSRRPKRWTEQEKETLVSLVSQIGPRWFEIAKKFSGRTECACKTMYKNNRVGEDERSGQSREDLMRHWDTVPDSGEKELDATKLDLAARDANEKFDLDIEGPVSAPANVGPTLKNHSSSSNAKKRQAIYVLEV